MSTCANLKANLCGHITYVDGRGYNGNKWFMARPVALTHSLTILSLLFPDNYRDINLQSYGTATAEQPTTDQRLGDRSGQALRQVSDQSLLLSSTHMAAGQGNAFGGFGQRRDSHSGHTGEWRNGQIGAFPTVWLIE